jgi:hypothetical protein
MKMFMIIYKNPQTQNEFLKLFCQTSTKGNEQPTFAFLHLFKKKKKDNSTLKRYEVSSHEKTWRKLMYILLSKTM